MRLATRRCALGQGLKKADTWTFAFAPCNRFRRDHLLGAKPACLGVGTWTLPPVAASERRL